MNSPIRLIAILFVLQFLQPAGAQIVQLFPFTNVWKFDQSGVDLSGQFQDPVFNDSAWREGPGLLYVETTALPQPRNTPLTLGRVTYYFRTQFNFPTNASNVTLISSNLIDDGAVIYLDGVEMSRVRMPLPPEVIAYTTLAGIVDNAVTYDVLMWTNLTLTAGNHVLAVEVHQQSPGSTDIVFGMSLMASIPAVPNLLDATEPRDRVVLRHQSTTLSVYASATPPVAYQWFFRAGTNSAETFAMLADATDSTYTITDMGALQEGCYYAVVSNPVGSVTSRTAIVTYSEDREPPVLVRATGSATFSNVVVEFNEPVHPEAADLSHYQISIGLNPLQLLGASLSPDGRNVILTTVEQSEHTLYQVKVNNVSDLTGQNVIASNSIAQFRSWSGSGCGGLLFEVYDTGAGGTAVLLLTNHPSFPDHAVERWQLTRFDTREVYPNDGHDAYGGRIRGIFLPPISGDWKFYLSSNNSGELWMNTNGPSPVGRARIAEEPDCCNPFLEDSIPGRLTSRPVRLVAGQPYYIEALYKEYDGADWCQVAAKMAADPTPPTELAPIAGDFLGVGAAPLAVAGVVTILESPASRTNIENALVSFQVRASNAFAAPLWHQWRRNGTDIPGATSATYSFHAALGDDGARFSCLVSVIGHSALTAEAVLTVRPDTVAPVCLGGRGTRSLNTVVLSFSERMDRPLAEDRVNYISGDAFPIEARLDATETNVWLTFEQRPAAGSTVEVLIFSLTDLVGNGLESAPLLVAVPVHVLTCGYAALEFYFNIPGASLGSLRSAPKFPLMPDRLAYVTLLEGPSHTMDNYGARISGWLLPPISGDYHFWISSDEQGEFWLSTDDDPANIRLIAYEPQWNGPRDWLGLTRRNGAAPENRSNTLFPEGVSLEASRKYYFESLVKEWLGGDNLAVTWQIPDGPAPVLGSEPISGAYMATVADPVADTAFITGGRIDITRIGNQLRFTWTCPGFRLQRNSDIGNVAGWSDVPGSHVSPVTIDVQSASEFFRLSR